MHNFSTKPASFLMFSAIAVCVPSNGFAQQDRAESSDIVVNGQLPQADPNTAIAATPAMKGPDVKGIISARSGDRVQIVTDGGTSTIVTINEFTKIKSNNGFLGIGRNKLTDAALLNGLPVTIKTLQSGSQLLASQINLRNTDLKTANMIRTGTAQGFAEQTAATQALRGRMGDIDQYNIKGTTNVNFDTGKAILTAQGKAELCAAVSTAETMKNAQILVVGYTDSTGSDEFNQQLSEKRASRVVNHIQQACGWKPYRMLTPTGMAESDPMASNDTAQGKAQNRRVSVNILVSKGLDGL
jgi:OmpA-OmpF porin, OOP family